MLCQVCFVSGSEFHLVHQINDGSLRPLSSRSVCGWLTLAGVTLVGLPLVGLIVVGLTPVCLTLVGLTLVGLV